MVVDLLFQEGYGTRKSYIGELSREGNGSRARACRKARSLAISTVTGGEISGGKVGNFQAEKTQIPSEGVDAVQNWIVIVVFEDKVCRVSG